MQLTLSDVRPRVIPQDDLELRRRRADQVEDKAWALIADAALVAISLPGLTSEAAHPLRDLLTAATVAAGRPAVQLLPQPVSLSAS